MSQPDHSPARKPRFICPGCDALTMTAYMQKKYGLCRYCYNDDANPPASARRMWRTRRISSF